MFDFTNHHRDKILTGQTFQINLITTFVYCAFCNYCLNDWHEHPLLTMELLGGSTILLIDLVKESTQNIDIPKPHMSSDEVLADFLVLLRDGALDLPPENSTEEIGLRVNKDLVYDLL